MNRFRWRGVAVVALLAALLLLPAGTAWASGPRAQANRAVGSAPPAPAPSWTGSTWAWVVHLADLLGFWTSPSAAIHSAAVSTGDTTSSPQGVDPTATDAGTTSGTSGDAGSGFDPNG